MTLVRWIAPAAIAAALVGCPRVAPRSMATRALAPERVGSREVIVVERPMEGHVALVVWVDAGSLDGAGTALVTAELLATLGEDLDAAVLPDGTRFRRMCPSSEIDACVREMNEALGLRSFSDEALAHARRAVVERRERGVGSSRREAETLAASAALGVELAPLGDPELAVTREDVAGFLEDHFGAERCLWIAVGDVAASRVVQALAQTPSRVARRERLSRNLDDDAPRIRAAEHAEPGHWAIARRLSSREEAAALANAWSARRFLAPSVQVSAFPTRAGWVAMVSFARGARQDIARWIHVEPRPLDSPITDETAWDIADRFGAGWVAGEPSASARDGVAVVGQGAEEAMEALALQAHASPWREAAFVRVDTPQLAVAWALPGAVSDGANALGATRIAAEILARRCASEARVRIDGDGVIVLHDDTPQRARAAASLWRDCVAMYEPAEDEIDAVRRALIASASLDDDRLLAAARALDANAPGRVAPDGSRTALSGVDDDDVLLRWRTWRDAGRWSFAGTVEERRPPNEASVSGLALAPTERHERIAVERPELVIVEGVPGCGDRAHGAAIERAWIDHVRRLGLDLTWSRSGAARELAWGAISVRGDASALAALAREPLPAADREQARREAAQQSRERRAELASPLELARRAAVGEPGTRCNVPTVRARAWLEPHPVGRH